MSILHAVTNLHPPPEALREVWRATSKVPLERIQALFVGGDVFHSDIQPSPKLVYEIRGNDVWMTFEVDPELRFLPELLAGFLITQELVAQRLKGICLVVIVRVDKVHDTETAHPEHTKNLVLRADHLPLLVHGTGVCVRLLGNLKACQAFLGGKPMRLSFRARLAEQPAQRIPLCAQ
jgi:hypothetical protein